DLIKRPHKIVIDCLINKVFIDIEDTILAVLDKFYETKCFALPVFQYNEFIGIIEKGAVLDKLKYKIEELYNATLISQKLKTSFLNSLSHEVRTPLNAVLGFLEIMSKLDADSFKTEVEYNYDVIRISADRFLFVMGDLIDLAIASSGESTPIAQEIVCIEDLFKELKEHFERVSPIQRFKSNILYVNPDTCLKITSDRKKLRHILYHLIDNAIKFSSDNSVKFGYKIKKQEIVFYVTNKGSRIIEDKRRKIFDAFYKQDINNNECLDGLGIGLTLVKIYTQLLRGNVSFVSNKNETTFNCALSLIKGTNNV
ncbi:MAG: HAMP domain-containing histidine kinase, partial [Candidatus Cloacimonetes bacterium]|nr:HAMP domain-containing histidine kinase [Candidatus Cloacimonadota bacterium]MDY0230824.1 HAMP domain-containing sensor histidine kinase [Candidatus Cloacimonadaceae bacterium]